MNDSSRVAVAERAAEAGGAVALDAFRDGIAVETKGGKTDVVTQADRDAQARVVEVVREEYPDDAIVGEEDDELKEVPDEGAAWVIDPIDGTNNYVRNLRVWATAVAAVVDGEPVAAAVVLPAMDDTYVAGEGQTERNGVPVSVSTEADPEKCAVTPTYWWDFDSRDQYAAAGREVVSRFGDMRRFGSAQAVLAFVADGALDGALTNLAANPWDTVAGAHLIRQAGGRVTDIEGDHWRHDSRGIVASNGAVHDHVLSAARGIDGLDD
jgi:myo-inositol-1(or 4)-monophosphatase